MKKLNKFTASFHDIESNTYRDLQLEADALLSAAHEYWLTTRQHAVPIVQHLVHAQSVFQVHWHWKWEDNVCNYCVYSCILLFNITFI